MKIAIYGAGAVGCVLGSALFTAGAEITLIARGAQREALATNGLTLLTPQGEQHFSIPVALPEDIVTPQDIILLTVKSPMLPEVAASLAPLMDEKTALVPIGNGIPWWFFRSWPGALAGFRIGCLDPEGTLDKHIPESRIIGGLTYMAASVIAPGIVQNLAKPRTILGEPNGQVTDRAQQLVALFENATFPASASTQIRSDIWLKLCWNIAFNPLAVITGLASGALAENSETRTRMLAIMAEMDQLSQALGLPLALDAEKHLEVGRKAGAHKPSMLQDYEAGKPLEVDAIVNAVIAIARQLQQPIPHIDALSRALQQKL